MFFSCAEETKFIRSYLYVHNKILDTVIIYGAK